PDWLNVMIFYHVLGHIDFFQNNLFYKNTWDIDLTGQALADKRLIAHLRSEKGRWVDYAIEFSRGIDNLVGYQKELNHTIMNGSRRKLSKIDFYFDIFLQKIKHVSHHEYLKEITRFNAGRDGSEDFFDAIISQYPEFDELYRKELSITQKPELDIIEYILQHSPFLKQDENKWINSVIQIVKNTSSYFQPQIRTKIMNEGWASYWHEYLFMRDDRICGHEIDFAKVNASVTSMPKVGLNPYALGLRLYQHIKEMEDRGCYSFEYLFLKDEVGRKKYNHGNDSGDAFILQVRENFNDFTFINTYIDQEFVDQHNLFVAGKRFNKTRMSWEFYIKSKKAEDYKQMIIDTLYHPPEIFVDPTGCKDGVLYLNHKFENKPLKTDFIENTMVGIEYLWGGAVHLETSEPVVSKQAATQYAGFWDPASQQPKKKQPEEIKWKRMLYVMENRKLHKREL
ncbi:MAG: SpoVR family protein, partial [Desulfobacula sp.]|nr:SpoVR family protein [Desulfobacula sp.]